MTTWKRLRRFEGAHSPGSAGFYRERLLSTADALRRVEQPVASLRDECANWLERLARNEKALTLLTSPGRGRKRTEKTNHIALDYLVQKELLGLAKAAEADVATAWCVAPKTVKDAWTDSQSYARWMLGELTESHVGHTRRRNEIWTRRTLLADISADLRDAHAPRGRRK